MDAASARDLARSMWHVLEPYHALVYFAPEVGDALAGIGMKGFWMGYVAGRVAPMGAVTPAVASAVLFNFHPSMAQRALPAAWQLAAPEAVLAARLHAVDGALWRLAGDELRSPELAGVALLARHVAEAADCGGRPLAAACQDLDWPTVPHLVLWQAATVLREHRGDGHVAALVWAGVSGLEAHVLAVLSDQSDRAQLQAARRWDDAAWSAAVEGLRARGLVDRAGELSKRGRALKERIETQTDALAAPPFGLLSTEEAERVLEVVGGLARRIIAAGGVPFPNPIGLPELA